MSEYDDALAAARREVGRLRLQVLREIDEALAAYADDLSRAIAHAPAEESLRSLALQRLREAIRAAQAELRRRLEAAIASGRDATFEDVAAIQAATQGVPRAAVASLAAWRAASATAPKTWRTLLRGWLDEAEHDVRRVVERAILEGVSPMELSRRLRPYVRGAAPFLEAFRGSAITDAMLMDPRFTRAAGELRFNADRIAFSEVQSARSEAEVRAFLTDPYVGAVRWTLSPNRGKKPLYDACDVLSRENLYGLGPGVFPIRRTPVRPHPFCRCELVPVILDIPTRDKPDPVRVGWRPEPGSLPDGITDARASRIAAQVEWAVRWGEVRVVG